MKIKSIALDNFRQFEKEKLVFTDVPGKKVTIVHGQTHIGKTTLVKAFLWCLYRSDDSFKGDPVLVNKDAEKFVLPGDKKTVSVTVELEHNGFDYVVKTEQSFTYFRNGNEGYFSPVTKDPVRHMIKMTPDGNPISVPSEQVDNEINDILPDNLKSYFFYDGENNKIDDVAEKSNLQDAVRNIMNLNIREELIKYYSDGFTGRLVERFEDKKTTSNLEEVGALKEQKSDLESKVENEKNNNIGLKKNIEDLKVQIKNLEDLIAANKESADLQEESRGISRKITELEERRNELFASLLKRCDSSESVGLAGLFAALAYKNSNLTAEYANIKTNERAYKHLTCDSVDEIIQKGVCVCGQKIESGSDFYKHLMEEKDFLSPRDYSASLKSFTDRFNDSLDAADSSASSLSRDAAELKRTIQNIASLRERADEITKKLKDFHGDVGAWQNELVEKNRVKSEDEGRVKYSEETIIPQWVNTIGNLKTRIDKYSDASEKNSHIQMYLNYIAAVKDMAQTRLDKKKEGIADTLEEQVNNLFHAIVGSNATTLRLNKANYNVEPYQSDLRISLSTGQKTMKNLAFVGGLIYLAKNKDKIGGSEGAELDEPDDYPLIMDAPFSNLSKSDIKRACTELPKYCSQLIITLLDKDYDLAIDVLKPFVDKSYILKTNETSTDSHFEEDEL
jgi:DNA sulfur modification protein DndD